MICIWINRARYFKRNGLNHKHTSNMMTSSKTKKRDRSRGRREKKKEQ